MGSTNNQGYEASKRLGTQIVGDLGREYGKGPQTFNQSLYTPMSDTTKGLIGQGLGDLSTMRSGTLGDVAGGGWLEGANPYFEGMLDRTRENVGLDVNSTFNANGLFGSDLHAKGLAEGLGNAELGARASNFENEWNRMLGAQGALNQGTALGLGYAGLMDQDTQNQRLGEYDLHTRQTQAPFQNASNYLGLLNANQNAPGIAREKPWWETLLGAGMGLAGSYLSGGYALPFGIGGGAR